MTLPPTKALRKPIHANDVQDMVIERDASERIPAVRDLFIEYAEALDIDLCFQGFDRELATLPGAYSAPRGCILTAVVNDETVGVVALRPIEADVCEMKRLYVQSRCRGLGVGRALAIAVIEAARELGYARMRLDTLAHMTEAMALYRSLGFRSTEPYRYNPEGDVRYYELDLRQ